MRVITDWVRSDRYSRCQEIPSEVLEDRTVLYVRTDILSLSKDLMIPIGFRKHFFETGDFILHPS